MINLSEITPAGDMSDPEYPLENLEDPFEVAYYLKRLTLNTNK